MKKYISTIAQIATYIGLPASFAATAFHQTAPQTLASHSDWLSFLTTQQSALVAPLVFATTVMAFALIIVHNLREDQRVADFSSLHLRDNSVVTKKIATAHQTPRKARLATAKAV